MHDHNGFVSGTLCNATPVIRPFEANELHLLLFDVITLFYESAALTNWATGEYNSTYQTPDWYITIT